MLLYIVKLLILLPLIGALAYASLRFAKHMQGRMVGNQGDRIAKIVLQTRPFSRFIDFEEISLRPEQRTNPTIRMRDSEPKR